MFRVLVAFVLVCTAIQLSACTGSLRLGSSVHADNTVTKLG